MASTVFPDSPVIDIDGIARRFGARWVLRGASLQMHPGEIVGLLGANGSGKSTLLRVLATLLRPHGGSARVAGADLTREPDIVREQVGYLAHRPGVYDDLTALENLRFALAMQGGGRLTAEAALERVGLGHEAGARVRGFSAGMQRRLALARLLLREPVVLLLDEPYSNLDSTGIALMNEVLREARTRGAAALVVLHETAPAAGMLTRVMHLRDGRVREVA
ncbi:MAG: heme ABC exporter ATP-binding protein CcmA [Gemmatimonadaceae bacterium]